VCLIYKRNRRIFTKTTPSEASGLLRLWRVQLALALQEEWEDSGEEPHNLSAAIGMQMRCCADCNGVRAILFIASQETSDFTQGWGVLDRKDSGARSLQFCTWTGSEKKRITAHNTAGFLSKFAAVATDKCNKLGAFRKLSSRAKVCSLAWIIYEKQRKKHNRYCRCLDQDSNRHLPNM
jgi:hypothetical protein